MPGQQLLRVTPDISPRNEPSRHAADQTDGPIGVYVHFPWCLSKCPYCDFVVRAAPREAIDHRAYADAVLRELERRAPAVSRRRLGSVFFGGGTPSLWDPREVGRVLGAITSTLAAAGSRDAESGGADVEVSLESDPSSLDGDRIRALFDVGVNRLSIGVQSLDDERLRFLGRIHSATDAAAAVRAAAGVRALRVSADLMYAVAGQSPEAAAREASALVDLGATHVSAYSLTIEPSTPFGRLARRGKLPLADDEAMAASFFAIDEALGRAGLEHYEVSNYAAPGQRSRHNVGYWQGRDYLGLGCGAYGTLASGRGAALRYRNHPSPDAYLAAAENHREDEQLDAATRLRERIMLGLRTREGLDLEAAAAELGTDPYPGARQSTIAELVSRRRLEQRGGRLSVPREAWIWVDDTAARLF